MKHEIFEPMGAMGITFEPEDNVFFTKAMEHLRDTERSLQQICFSAYTQILALVSTHKAAVKQDLTPEELEAYSKSCLKVGKIFNYTYQLDIINEETDVVMKGECSCIDNDDTDLRQRYLEHLNMHRITIQAKLDRLKD